MNFKPGDKVRFLNTKGGGTVTKVINSFMVAVAIEDGFEIPTLISELVAIEPSSNSNDRLFLREDEKSRPVPAPEPEVVENDRVSAIRAKGSDVPVPAGVYLVYVPQDQQWIMTGMIDVYLINHTGYDILYNFFLKDEKGKYTGIDYGSVPGNSKLALESIVREDIELWTTGVLQLMFHRDEADKVLMPVSSAFHLKGASFYKEGSFKPFALLGNQKAIIYSACDLARIHSTTEFQALEKEGLDDLPESARKFNPGSAIDRYRIAPREAEVDLHISALRDNYSRLSPHEILTIQLTAFERLLESAVANNYTRVVFIHGVGNGSLKQAIVHQVRDYGGLEFRNASFAKYGNGAIELVIHQNV